jgi:hypothetical protein
MSSAFLVVMVALAAFVWVRRNQRARRAWLARVNLAGTWECPQEETTSVLEISGGPAEGRYTERAQEHRDEGSWLLHGSHIRFDSDQTGPADCVFRLFGDGSIGIDGATRERRIYVRRVSNVVPLRQHQ